MIRMLAALVVTMGGLVAASLWLDRTGLDRPGLDRPESPPLSAVDVPELQAPETAAPAKIPEIARALEEQVAEVAAEALAMVETVAEVAIPAPEPDRSVLRYEPTGRYQAPPLPEPADSGDRAAEGRRESDAVPEADVREDEVWRFEEDDPERRGEAALAEHPAEDPGDLGAVSLDQRARLIRRLLDVYARIGSAP